MRVALPRGLSYWNEHRPRTFPIRSLRSVGLAGAKPFGQYVQLGLSLYGGDAGLEPADNSEGHKRFVVQGNLALEQGIDLNAMREWKPNLGKIFERHAAEAGRRDSNNGEPLAVNQYLRTEHTGVGRKMPFPELMPEHHDGSRTFLIVAGQQRPSHPGRCSKKLEVISRDHAGIDAFSAEFSGRDIGGKTVHVGSEPGEHRALVAIVLKFRQRDEAPAGISSGIAAEDADQLVWLRDRQRTEEQDVNNAEDCCVGADAQGKSQHRDEGKSRAFPEHPRAIAKIVKKVVQHRSLEEFRMNPLLERENESILHKSVQTEHFGKSLQEERPFSARAVCAHRLFLALFGELPSAFFGMNENIIRVAKFLVARVPDFAKTV